MAFRNPFLHDRFSPHESPDIPAREPADAQRLRSQAIIAPVLVRVPHANPSRQLLLSGIAAGLNTHGLDRAIAKILPCGRGCGDEDHAVTGSLRQRRDVAGAQLPPGVGFAHHPAFSNPIKGKRHCVRGRVAQLDQISVHRVASDDPIFELVAIVPGRDNQVLEKSADGQKQLAVGRIDGRQPAISRADDHQSPRFANANKPRLGVVAARCARRQVEYLGQPRTCPWIWHGIQPPRTVLRAEALPALEPAAVAAADSFHLTAPVPL